MDEDEEEDEDPAEVVLDEFEPAAEAGGVHAGAAAPTLAMAGFDQTGAAQIQLTSETGGKYALQESTDLLTWTSVLTVTNVSGVMVLTAPAPDGAGSAYYRVARSF